MQGEKILQLITHYFRIVKHFSGKIGLWVIQIFNVVQSIGFVGGGLAFIVAGPFLQSGWLELLYWEILGLVFIVAGYANYHAYKAVGKYLRTQQLEKY